MTMCLSDEIKRFRSQFDGHEHAGMTISGRQVETLVARCNTLLALARELEEEASQAEWNRRAAVEQAKRANGKVVLFGIDHGEPS